MEEQGSSAPSGALSFLDRAVNPYILPSTPPRRLSVRFNLEPTVDTIESSWTIPRRTATKMHKQVYETFPREEVTDAMLDEAADLFSEHYGIWGEHSHSPGQRVKLSGSRLREQYMPDHSDSYHARVTVDGKLAGSAFACRWKHDDRTICWVTQLVVHKDYREHGLASGILKSLRSDEDGVYGIISCHPVACLAAARSFGRNIENVSLDFVRANAEMIMQASPIPYIREARLRGPLFDPGDQTEIISGVDTQFFVDHGEPLEALSIVKETCEWPLGSLHDGYEYLLIFPSKYRRTKSLIS